MQRLSIALGWNNSSALTRVAWIVLPAITVLSLMLPPYMVLASFSYLLMMAGIVLRKERVSHFRLMATAMSLDVILVLILQVQRSAVQTAIGDSLSLPQHLHIAFSLGAVLLYLPQILLGLSGGKAPHSPNRKSLHKWLGILTFAFRTLGYIFMFSMQK